MATSKFSEKRAELISALEKRVKCILYGVEFVYLYLFGILVAFAGWVVENCVMIRANGYMDSRFHMLPFISPYALIPIAYHIVLNDADDIAVFGKKIFKNKSEKSVIASNVLTWAMLCCTVFFGELAVGNLWDKLFGVQLWNYGHGKLTVTQYAGVKSAVGAGTGAYLAIKFIYKPVLNFLRCNVKYETARAICLTLGVVLPFDTCCMALHIAIIGTAPVYWVLYL